MCDVTRKERKLYRADIAEMIGLAGPRSLGRAKLPPPDGREVDGIHVRPWWREATITAWIAARPGKGWRAGKTRASA